MAVLTVTMSHRGGYIPGPGTSNGAEVTGAAFQGLDAMQAGIHALSRAADVITRLGRLPGELGVVQVGVQAARREEFLVRAALGDPAGVDDQDLVGFPDCGQAVRDHQ